MGKTVKIINENKYNVFVLPEAKTKMELYCELCQKEIGWLGLVEQYNSGFLITDVFLLKQEVHSATTELNPESMLELWNTLNEDQQSKLKIWGHSHVNMSTSPSGQDDSQMDYFKDGNDWFIRLITNKKGEMNITIYDYKNGIEVHTDELYVYDEKKEELRASIKEEIKEKVKEKTYTTIATTTFTKKDDETTVVDKLEHTDKKENKCLLMFKGLNIKYIDDFDDLLKSKDYYNTLI